MPAWYRDRKFYTVDACHALLIMYHENLQSSIGNYYIFTHNSKTPFQQTNRAMQPINRAFSYIKDLVGASDAGEELPGIRPASIAAGVGANTMFKTYRLFREQGIIIKHQGGPYTVSFNGKKKLAAFLPPGSRAVRVSRAPQKVMERIREAIFSGAYASGTLLPPTNELAETCGTSYTTLKKALALLEESGLLTPYKHGYRVRPLSISKGSMAVRFFTMGYGKGGGLFLDNLGREFLNELEIECSRSRLDLRATAYYSRIGRHKLEFWNPHEGLCRFIDRNDCAGYILFISAVEESLPLLLDKFKNIGKPVAIIDVAGDWHCPKHLKRKSVRIFSDVVSSRPGEMVGRYCIQKGLCTIAYISPFHAASWSRRRLQGIGKILKSAGSENAQVIPFTIDNPPKVFSRYSSEAVALSRYDQLLRSYR
ncbi:MAG: GntR family transcriptional regulator, partial [Chitinivibrionales bacterium]|nr:GntR family transcriptional regulator [Chitinivibrionales bacterium]